MQFDLEMYFSGNTLITKERINTNSDFAFFKKVKKVWEANL